MINDPYSNHLQFIWLVVCFCFVFFHSVGNVVIPTDEFIFFRGVGIPPTRLLLTIINHIITIFILTMNINSRLPTNGRWLNHQPDMFTIWKWCDFHHQRWALPRTASSRTRQLWPASTPPSLEIFFGDLIKTNGDFRVVLWRTKYSSWRTKWYFLHSDIHEELSIVHNIVCLLNQWPFQDPKMEVPIPYIRPIF